MAVMSVPSALRNSPETASIRDDTILATQLTIPSKIQSKIVIHLHSAFHVLLLSQYIGRRRSGAAGKQQ